MNCSSEIYKSFPSRLCLIVNCQLSSRLCRLGLPGIVNFLFLFCTLSSFSQSPTDTIPLPSYPLTATGLEFSPKQLIVPGILIAFGVYGSVDKSLNEKIQEQAGKWNGNTIADDIMVFVPGASAYILDWCGVDSKHNLMDKTVITATSAAFTLVTCNLLKYATSEERPDGSNNHSFPSQHTAIAFAGAELLRQEYKDKSVWYGIASYGVAAATGFLRIYNNEHWFSDVLTGAGIGILSAKAAYWLYPSIRKFYSKSENNQITIIPYGSSREIGFCFSARF